MENVHFTFNFEGKERILTFQCNHFQTVFFENGKFLFCLQGNIMDTTISRRDWNKRLFHNLKIYDKEQRILSERRHQIETNQFFNPLLINNKSSLKQQTDGSSKSKQECKPVLWVKRMFERISEL